MLASSIDSDPLAENMLNHAIPQYNTPSPITKQRGGMGGKKSTSHCLFLVPLRLILQSIRPKTEKYPNRFTDVISSLLGTPLLLSLSFG